MEIERIEKTNSIQDEHYEKLKEYYETKYQVHIVGEYAKNDRGLQRGSSVCRRLFST